MKSLLKRLVVFVLAKQVHQLYKKHSFKTIIIAGSIGKTSTKFAIASVLKQKYRVRFQEGNYNDLVSIPLVYFGQDMPSLLNPLAWIKVFMTNRKVIKSDFPFDFVILELGTDGPGQIAAFQKYLKADLGVLTAITPEHMEYFADLDAVAKEELTVSRLCNQLIINKDLVDAKYIQALEKPALHYSLKGQANYQLGNLKYDQSGYQFDVMKNNQLLLHANHEAIAESQLYSLTAAAAIGDLAQMSGAEIESGLHTIQAVSGRMQRLAGVNNSVIIDDTYNSSPEAVKGALDTLYKLPAKQKIAILGNMNELGKYSQSAHSDIGLYCDPSQLEIVLTIGPDANQYLAPAAQQKGCHVKTFNSPYELGKFIKPLIKNGAVILAKGSQNGVFAEEAVKILLANPADSSKLVRQSAHWLKVKQKQFGSTA